MRRFFITFFWVGAIFRCDVKTHSILSHVFGYWVYYIWYKLQT